ncbi:hypothetical protein ACFLZL_05350 [Thermodesulfobacteriota bacterium]
MKKNGFWLTVATVFLFSNVCLAEAPKRLGDFVLGENISAYEGRIQKDTVLTIRYQEYLSEVETNRIDGFKSGLIAYGTCDKPGQIIRIKLKYADSSKTFFKTLLGRFKKRFGEPDDWRGDPFHVVIAWKWNFLDKDGNQISLTLQHNTMDQEEKKGNAVKMTLTSQIIKEHLCYEKKHPEKAQPKPVKSKKQKRKVDWDLFIPRQ